MADTNLTGGNPRAIRQHLLNSDGSVAPYVAIAGSVLPAALGPNGGLKTEPIAGVGPANLNSNTAAPTNSSTTIVIARPTRRRVTILNTGSLTVYVGPTTATTSMAPLYPGSAITLSSVQLIAGITTAGTGAVAFWDEYD